MRDRPRILIVEDEQIVAEDLREVLERNGYTIPAIAASGPAALRSIDAMKPDLILMDIHLDGDIDGIETARRIQDDADIPIVYLTSFSTEGYLQDAKKTNPYGYITKPFDPQTIITTIEIALNKHAIDMRSRANLETYRFIADYTSSWEMWFDPDENPIFISPSCERITGYAPDELMKNPALLKDMVYSEDRRIYDALEGNSGKPASLRFRIRTRSGTIRWIQHSSNPLYDAHGFLRGRRISNIDITREQEQIEKFKFAIQESSKLYFSVAETMKDTCVLVYDLENGIEYINSKGAALFGEHTENLLHKTIPNLSGPAEICRIFSTIDRFIQTGTPAHFEETYSRGKEDDVFLEGWLFALKNEVDEPRKIWAILHDVSDKKRAEQKILGALKEKEILLREIHHRVKNNLQQVASLLYLQERRGRNLDAVAILQESRNRIYSIALAHEVLYNSEDMANVSVLSYISQLITCAEAKKV